MDGEAAVKKKYVGTYSIPMLDIDSGTILKGSTDDDEVLCKLSDEAINKYAQSFKHKTIVADESDYSKDYMAHPDSILLKRKKAGAEDFEFSNEIFTVFPLAHGKGELKAKISYDGGLTFPKEEALKEYPSSWEFSQETPTVYRLIFNKDNKPDENDLLIIISGAPYWAKTKDGPSLPKNGFNVSISAPKMEEDTGDIAEGRCWSEFENWFGNGDEKLNHSAAVRNPLGKRGALDCLVAMSSLTRLKDPTTHEWKNEWMGLFHDREFHCYKTILSFSEPQEDNTYPTYNVCGRQMVMNWSEPEKYMQQYREIEKKAQMCEVECIRSECSNGNKLAIIARSQRKKMDSLISFSTDEGQTWTPPIQLPYALNGERHKARWIKDNHGNDKLFITFRSIERSTYKRKKYNEKKWVSEGYVAWCGSWDDLKNNTEGDFRIKVAHTYFPNSSEITRNAHADTGYCGNVVLPDGRLFTCSYGRFSPQDDKDRGDTTYIAGRVLDIAGLYDIMENSI